MRRFDDTSDIRIVMANVVHNVSYFIDTLQELRSYFNSSEEGL